MALIVFLMATGVRGLLELFLSILATYLLRCIRLSSGLFLLLNVFIFFVPVLILFAFFLV